MAELGERVLVVEEALHGLEVAVHVSACAARPTDSARVPCRLMNSQLAEKEPPWAAQPIPTAWRLAVAFQLSGPG
eukprot:6828689-Prymnesium_polylepis.1